MALDIEKLQSLEFTGLRQNYVARDTILYALGLGYGEDPLDEAELPFVFENGLRVVPSMCSVLCQPGFWARDPAYGIDWVRILHAEQAFAIHSPLQPAAGITGEVRIVGMEDKGPGKGVLIHQEKQLTDESGILLASVRTTIFARGNGGEGAFGRSFEPAAPLPDRKPDLSIDIPTSRRAALIYRLSGDWNPLHADPAIAQKAGFDQPILHGLCTFGIACRALIASYCDNDPTRLRSMFARFSSPVFPGETIRIEILEDRDLLRFRAIAVERNIVVLDRCSAVVGTPPN